MVGAARAAGPRERPADRRRPHLCSHRQRRPGAGGRGNLAARRVRRSGRGDQPGDRSDRTVWAGSPLGVASLPPGTGEWRQDPNGVPGAGVTALAMTPDGRLAAAAPQGVWVRSAAGTWGAVADPGAAASTRWSARPTGHCGRRPPTPCPILPQAAAAPVAVRPAAGVRRRRRSSGRRGHARPGRAAGRRGRRHRERAAATLDRSALTVTRATAAGDAWRLTSGADVYVVVRRDTPGGCLAARIRVPGGGHRRRAPGRRR